MATKKTGKKAGKKAAKAKNPKASGKKSKKKGAPSKSKGKSNTMTYRARPKGNTTSKPKRAFGDPLSLPKPSPAFTPIPSANKQPADLSFDLAGVADPAIMQGIASSGKMVFHCVGDTGDIHGSGVQKEVATQMEDQYNAAGNNDKPAFFYHLGDVVYYNGESVSYRDQFYDAYKYYTPLIFAIPGNHDGQTAASSPGVPAAEPSLTGFFTNFCDSKRTPSPYSPYRYTMDQPWPYWVLHTPMATFIGLYSNVEGTIDKWNGSSQPQYDWLVKQLQQADSHKALLLAIHHPPFSLDSDHGGYPDILDAIDQATAAAGRYPDLVLSGHIHSYQRFERTVNHIPIHHVVAGNGGYASAKTFHKLQLDPTTHQKIKASPAHPFKTTRPDVSLMNYNDDLPGFLQLTVDKQFIRGEYFTNDMSGGAQSAQPFDTFGFDYVNKKIV